MQPIPLNIADAVVLAVIIVIVTLIVRGMLHGSIRTCDSTSCAGDCGSCGSRCAAPHIKLNRKQRAHLREIDRRAKEIA